MKNILTITALIALGAFLSSCESEEVANALDCVQKANDYNDSRAELTAYFTAIEQETKEFSCAEFSPLWNNFQDGFDELCVDSRTSDLVENVNDVTAAAALLNNLEGCDIDFD